MTTKVYVGDVGTVITLGVASDISAATARSIEVHCDRRKGSADDLFALAAQL